MVAGKPLRRDAAVDLDADRAALDDLGMGEGGEGDRGEQPDENKAALHRPAPRLRTTVFFTVSAAASPEGSKRMISWVRRCPWAATARRPFLSSCSRSARLPAPPTRRRTPRRPLAFRVSCPASATAVASEVFDRRVTRRPSSTAAPSRKEAVTLRRPVIPTRQRPVATLSQPLQPTKREPGSAIAFRVKPVPVGKVAEQTRPQSSPAGSLDTAPLPSPAAIRMSSPVEAGGRTRSGAVAGTKAAPTVASAFIGMVQLDWPLQAPGNPSKRKAPAGAGGRGTRAPPADFAG